MKKKILLSVIILLTFVCGVVTASSINGSYKGNPIVRVIANGKEVKPEVPAQIIDGSTLIPLRAVSEALGADVKWNPETYSVDVVSGNAVAQDEPLYFITEGPLHLLHPQAVASSILMTSRDKTVIYQKDRDYSIGENGTVTRLPSGTIGQKETVLISYRYTQVQSKNYNVNESAIQKTVTKLKSNQPVNIVFFGDSTTMENEHTQGIPGHVAQIEAELKKKYQNSQIHVYNKGQSGDRLAWNTKRLQKDVLDLNPDLVVVCFGINDNDHKHDTTDLASFQTYMDTLLKTLTDQGTEVIARTPNTVGPATRFPAFDQYVDIMRKTAGSYKVGISDIYQKYEDAGKQGITTYPDMTEDAIHPNARGQLLIADELIKFFK